MLANGLRRKGPIHGQSCHIPRFHRDFRRVRAILFAPAFLAERADAATRILLAAGLFAIAIAVVVRK
jgi:hypothetical protein